MVFFVFACESQPRGEANAYGEARRRASPRAFDDVNITISAANALALSLGRYVFLPYQRAQVERVGLPTQNGETHFDAGDARAKEASFITTTKDPAGFTLVDLLAWGSIGHALGFLALASQSAQQML